MKKFIVPGLMLLAVNVPAQPENTVLRPPHAALPPTFWEQHGWAVIWIAIGILLLNIVLLVWIFRRRPAIIPAPAALARAQLQALNQRASVLAPVSAILRNYLKAVCGLEAGEYTATEICAAVEKMPWPFELKLQLQTFLKTAETQKFSNVAPIDYDFPALAAKLISEVEQARSMVAEKEATV